MAQEAVVAQITKRGDNWQARVRKAGISQSASFPRKADAVAWANQAEADIHAGRIGKAPDRSFGGTPDDANPEDTDTPPAKRKAPSRQRRLSAPSRSVAEIKLEMASMSAPPAGTLQERFRTNDATIEALHDLLAENPRGILVFRDELVGLLKGWEKQGHEQDRGFYLEAWNGQGNFPLDRIGRGHVICDNMCVSILGGTQPDKVRGYLYQARQENDGLLQRFQLLVYPDTPLYTGMVDEYDKLMAKVKSLRTSDPMVARAWDFVVRNYIINETNEALKLKEGSRDFMHEVIAQIGQNADITKQSWWRDMLNAVKSWLIRQGFTGFIKYSDIQDMVMHSLKVAAKPRNDGGPRGGLLGDLAMGGLYSLGTHTDRIVSDFTAKVRAAIETDDPTRRQPITVSDVAPATLQMFGWTDVPVVARAGKDGILKMHYEHGMTADEIGRLVPETLRRPAMILQHVERDGTESIRLVAQGDKSGRPVIIGVHPESSGTVGDVHLVATMLPHSHGWDYVRKAIGNGDLLYRDTNSEASQQTKAQIHEAQKRYSREPRSLLGILPNSAPSRGNAYKVLSQSDIVKWERENWGDNPLFSNKGQWWYSALSATIPGMAKIADKHGMVSPVAAKAWLLARQKEGKFKQVELAWSGLTDWLDAQTGKVSVADIENFLRAGGVRVEEVVLGQSQLKELSLDQDEESGNWYIVKDEGEILDGFDTEEDAQAELDRMRNSGAENMRRHEIINMWSEGKRTGDHGAINEALAMAGEFNKKHPEKGLKITPATLARSYAAKQRNQSNIKVGAFVRNGRESLREEGAFADVNQE